MNKASIYDYSDYRAFLTARFDAIKSQRPGFSLRAWARQLELKSPSLLTMILKGQRHPTYELTLKFAKGLGLTTAETTYFDQLVKLARLEPNNPDRLRVVETLREISPRKNLNVLDFDHFVAVANWYHFAIREMVLHPGFEEDGRWIAKRLMDRITPREATEALATLLRIGMLKRDPRGRLRQADEHVGTKADVPSEAVKCHHEQMLEIAKRSIRDTAVESRDISGSTFNLDPKDLPRFKEDLRRMRKTLYQKYETASGKETYQLSVQLFPLTRPLTQKKGPRP